MYKKFDHCIVCGSPTEELEGYERYFLVQCEACRLVFSQRVPSMQELFDCYGLYPRDNVISPITIKRCNQLLDGFEAYRRNNSIIDVGAGDGWFLYEAAKRGWDVYGTEFEDRAIENCVAKGIRMRKGVLDPNNYLEGFFDIVTSFEVVEHINNPREEFKNFNQILRKGGLVYVTTPNFNSLSRTILKAQWNVLNYPEHLTYYSTTTLKRAFGDAGFRALSMKTAGFSFSRYADSRKPPVGVAVDEGRQAVCRVMGDEKMRTLTENNSLGRLAKWTVNGLFNLFGKGDGIKAMFIK